jgi:hypothetical protein
VAAMRRLDDDMYMQETMPIKTFIVQQTLSSGTEPSHALPLRAG